MSDQQKYPFGDLKLFQNEAGTDIRLLEISPECDPTLTTAIRISIGTDAGSNYWGNSFFTSDNGIGNDIGKIGVVSTRGMRTMKEEITSSLQWLLDENYADNIDVKVKVISIDKYGISLDVSKEDKKIFSTFWEYIA